MHKGEDLGFQKKGDRPRGRGPRLPGLRGPCRDHRPRPQRRGPAGDSGGSPEPDLRHQARTALGVAFEVFRFQPFFVLIGLSCGFSEATECFCQDHSCELEQRAGTHPGGAATGGCREPPGSPPVRRESRCQVPEGGDTSTEKEKEASGCPSASVIFGRESPWPWGRETGPPCPPPGGLLTDVGMLQKTADPSLSLQLLVICGQRATRCDLVPQQP